MHLIVTFLGFLIGIASPALWADLDTMPAWTTGVVALLSGAVSAIVLRWIYERRPRLS